MKIHSFWVVTKPAPNSILPDILFEADLKRFALQIRGGLNPADIICIYTEKAEAEAMARDLLRRKTCPTIFTPRS